MRCCTCESIRSVGCYPHCGTITLPLTALQTGEHQLVWLHAGIQRSLTLDLTGGQAIAFPNDDLFPESADVTFQIIQPDGNPLPASDGSLCFRLLPAWLYSAGAVLFFSFLNAATSYLLYFTFQEGQLLHPYRQWLERNLRFAGGMRSFWYKPLGGCIICMNVWLAMLSFGLVVAGIGIEPAGWCLPFWGIGYVVVSNAWLRVLLIKN